jgi:hypothetical protein
VGTDGFVTVFLAQKLPFDTARMNLDAEVLVHQAGQSLRSHRRLGDTRRFRNSITAGVNLWPLRGPVFCGIKLASPPCSKAA